MQVAFVIQKFLGLSGGTERVVTNVANALKSRGMDVSIVIYDSSQGHPAYSLDDIQITNLFPGAGRNARSDVTPSALKTFPHFGPLGHIKWAVTHGLYARRLIAHFRKSQPDVIVGFLPPAITAAVSAGQALGIPAIASVHNLPEQDFGDGGRWDQNPVYRRRARLALAKASAITVLMPEFRSWFEVEIADRVHVVPNAIARLSNSTGKSRQKLVLGVGRLTEVKRFHLLIEAWALLHAEFPDWTVHIYGEGPERENLANLIETKGLKGSVSLKGTNPHLGPVYDGAAVLCHPADYEGFGLVVGEAMAHGVVPLAYASSPGVNALINSDVDGLLVEDGVVPLTDGLRRLIRNEQLRADLGDNALEIVTTFSAKEIVHLWEKILRQVVDRGQT